jgi:hypothetical protein
MVHGSRRNVEVAVRSSQQSNPQDTKHRCPRMLLTVKLQDEKYGSREVQLSRGEWTAPFQAYPHFGPLWPFLL